MISDLRSLFLAKAQHASNEAQAQGKRTFDDVLQELEDDDDPTSSSTSSTPPKKAKKAKKKHKKQ